MTYLLLDAAFLAVVLIVGCLALARSPGRHPLPVVVTLAVLVVVSIVFDNVMIAVGLVGYDRDHISGVLIGIAPIEDFAYAIAAALLLPSLWVLFSPRRVGA